MSKPKIRFKGYEEDWEQRKLDDVLKRRIEQRQQSEEYPRLAFASGQGVIPLSERKTNNREQLTKDEYTKKYLVTELNDIVYNPANVKYGAIDRNKCGRGLISPIYVTFTTNEVPGFIERIVTSHDFQQRALRFEEGTVTKRQSVNPEDLVTLDILVAPKREEQQKIATYFDSLDHLITLHQRKCEETKKLKKYMLQKMFPQNGKRVPEIRFAGFTDDWEQRKLGDQMYIKSRIGWQRLTQDEYQTEGDYYLITGTDINEVTHSIDLTRAYYVSKERYEKDSNIQIIEGDIIVTKDGTIGKVAMVCGLDKPATLNSHLFVLRDLSGKLNNRFLLHVLDSPIFKSFVEKTKTGSTLTGLPQKTMVEFRFKVSSMKEQERISHFLDNLDSLITLHQRKCEELQKIKKFMLQNMFV